MRKLRGMSQDEMDQCWKNLAERLEEEVPDENKGRGPQKRGLPRQRRPAGVEACAQKQEIQIEKMVRRLLGKNFRLDQRV